MIYRGRQCWASSVFFESCQARRGTVGRLVPLNLLFLEIQPSCKLFLTQPRHDARLDEGSWQFVDKFSTL